MYMCYICIGICCKNIPLINPSTKKIISSRDVIFLMKSYGDWAHKKEQLMVPMTTSVMMMKGKLGPHWH